MQERTPLIDPPIADILRSAEGPVLSYEFFPPKTDKGMTSLQHVIEELAPTNPDFVTVTYGAGGSTRNLTFEICELLRRFRFQPVMPHLTCVGSARSELEDIADHIHEDGFRNIMTLRGDPPRGQTSFTPPADGLSCARDLLKLLKSRHTDFCLGAAGYPEGHPEANSLDEEMDYLKSKIDAGAEFITTQMFFENDTFYRFLERCDQAGIRVPILPGVMPALSLGQITRIVQMCGSQLPAELSQRLEKAGDDRERAMSAGLMWCMEQLVDLLQHGVPGIHLYILNQTRPAQAFQLAKTFTEMTR